MNRTLALRQGEDLRAVALRELGSAARWTEIAALNGLRLPFIIDSYRAEDRRPGTLIWGDRFLVPAIDGADDAASADTVLGRDIALVDGDITIVNGDIGVLAGEANIVQAIRHRLKTLRGELVQHPRYGSHVALAMGLPGGPFASLTAAGWCHETLREEPRLRTIEGVDARVSGDVLRVAARVVIIGSNTSTDFNAVLNT